MAKQNYNVLGVMSGTSLDGMDLAHIQFTISNGRWDFAIGQAATVPYTQQWVERLRDAVGYSPGELAKLNTEYTQLAGGIIKWFVAKNRITGLDAVCAHGHTILHQPGRGITLQIGNLPEIAALAGQTVVCDFRVQDVQLGGQGAPLVPVGDRLLFGRYDYCLNLGGFSNISFEEDGRRIAFDICPVNTVLNHYAQLLGHEYDNGGTIARGGRVISELAAALDALDFYAQPYPKSLGFEFVRQTVLPLIDSYAAAPRDKLHTFVKHIAGQIAKVMLYKGKGSLLVTGGGAYNSFLIECLQDLLPNADIVVPDDKTIQYKEALIFALLGVLKLRGEVNALASVTGARHDHSSGCIYLP